MRRYVTITNRTSSDVTLVGTTPNPADESGATVAGLGLGSVMTQTVPPFGRLVIGEDEYALLAALNDASTLSKLMVIRSHRRVSERSVRAYGCVGDGLVDDTARFQAAIDAVAERGGGTLEVDTGVYLLSGDGIVLHGGVSISGESSSSCIMRQSSDGACISVDETRCSITGLTLVGPVRHQQGA